MSNRFYKFVTYNYIMGIFGMTYVRIEQKSGKITVAKFWKIGYNIIVYYIHIQKRTRVRNFSFPPRAKQAHVHSAY